MVNKMIQEVKLYDLVEYLVDISGKYLPGDLDSFYYEIVNNLEEKQVNKNNVLNAIKNTKNFEFGNSSFNTAFYHWIEVMDCNEYKIVL